MKIIKRNKTEVDFAIGKIIAAVSKANNVVEDDEKMTPKQILRIADSVQKSCEKMGRALSVEAVSYTHLQYINADFAVLIPVDRFNRDDWSKYGAFLVGKDLAAGEYRVSSKGSSNVSSYQITVGEPDSEIIKSSTLHGSCLLYTSRCV